MAKNEHKRQQKLAKKQKRTKELKKQRNVALNISSRELIRSAAERGSWLGCYHYASQGMHQVYAIRQTRMGVCASVFLVDSYCLGIKDVFFVRSFDMDVVRDRLAGPDMKLVTPESALKFLQGAMAYSKGLGFPLHPEANMCLGIFGDTNASECTEDFIFGDNGKPHYISGPNDSEEKQFSIIQTLSKLGDGNFQFTLVSGHDTDAFGLSEFEDDDSYEDEYLDDNGSYEELGTTINAESVKQVN